MLCEATIHGCNVQSGIVAYNTVHGWQNHLKAIVGLKCPFEHQELVCSTLFSSFCGEL